MTTRIKDLVIVRIWRDSLDIGDEDPTILTFPGRDTTIKSIESELRHLATDDSSLGRDLLDLYGHLRSGVVVETSFGAFEVI